MLYLLATSALIAHYRQEAGWEQVQAIFDDGSANIIVASVTLPEFARRLRDLGAGSAESRQTLADYKGLLSGIVALDAAVPGPLLRSATAHRIVCPWWTR